MSNAGKDGDGMASVNREKRDALVRKADALRTDWLMLREEHLAEQLAANIEVRKVWIDSDPVRAGEVQEDKFASVKV